jgi:adenine-specific DNA-methyltransferase
MRHCRPHQQVTVVPTRLPRDIGRKKNEGFVAEIDELLTQIDDEGLRSQLTASVEGLRRQLKFGLVFEKHIPESIRLYGVPPRPGDTIQLRGAGVESEEFRVLRANTRTVTALDASGEERKLAMRDVVVLKKFGEPAYPALKPHQERIERSETRPCHSVINGENFHTLQLLRYLYRGQVDCIYIDPPYNTGDRDWQYNNRYIDEKDRWRHSKWLSFMEKRLLLAKDLLREDGVLIVTIDEHEVHHLGVLLEQVFPGRLLQTITIVMNPKGTGKINFARVNEYALFCMPKGTESVVTGLPEHEADMLTGKRHVEHVLQQDEDDAQEEAESELDDSEADDLVPELLADEVPLPFPREDLDLWELRHARRRGGESSYRHQRKNQFYPLYVDPEAGQVVRAGESIPLDQEPSFEPVDGLVPLWPIDKEGNQRCWRYIPESMQRKIDGGFVVLGQTSADGKSWTVNYWVQKTQRKKYKTVWWSTSHDAGTHGTSMLHKLLGDRTAFPFPKSLYAVRDTLLTVVRDRPNALILDFFAGSGTTLHATALINALDGGQRRCILVSNNEVAAKSSDRLLRAGHLPGDEEYEKHGIFWKATRPRCEAAITGRDARGKPVEGTYQGIDRDFADGFEENVEFYDLVYLDRDSVREGGEFSAIEPSLWLAAGGVGSRPTSDPGEPFAVHKESNYAILFDRKAFRRFLTQLRSNPQITHVYLVTDSESSYTQMRAKLPEDLHTSMLYRDYLANFRINTLEAYR